MTRRFMRRVARALVGVVLLAQLSISAYACPGVSLALQASGQPQTADMSMAGAGEAAGSAMNMAAPVGNDMAGAMDPSSANLCAEHCKNGQQSDNASTVTVPVAALTALYAVPLVPEAAPPPRPAAASISALVAASVPHAILHCVYRI